MSIKKFIESNGATCRNWRWSWSYVNHAEKFVIFLEWQNDPHTELGVILDTRWEYIDGKKQNGWGQSIEHLDLIENHGYELKTFPCMMELPHKKLTIAKRGDFTPQLTTKSLRKETENGVTRYFAD